MLKCRLPSPRWPYATSMPCGTCLRHPVAGDVDEPRHLRHGHRDVVLEARAVLRCASGIDSRSRQKRFALAVALRDGHASRHPPIRARPRAPSAGASSSGSPARDERQLGAARTTAMARDSGSTTPGMCVSSSSTPIRGMSSKGRHAVAAAPARSAPEQVTTAAAGIAHGDECGGVERSRRIQLEAGRRDHTQRALGAQEQRLDVVAGVVLAQAA